MAAIAGAVCFDSTVPSAHGYSDVDAALAHRGPGAVWACSHVALSHRARHGPRVVATVATRGAVLHVAADARLDNTGSLAAELGLPPASSPHELIASSYERWGDECAGHLLGDFAFVIWDATRQRLFCGRDHIGIRPFYYHYQPGRCFMFATEIGALLRSGKTSRTINETFLADYVALNFSDHAATFFTDIVRLPAAHTLTVDATGLRLRRYWNAEALGEIRLATPAEYETAFRDIFVDAVRRRIECSDCSGALLSGGLDSSSIVGVGARIVANRPLPTFSIVFDSVPEADERPYISAVTAFTGTSGHHVLGDAVAPLANVNALYAEQHQPFWNPHLTLHHALFERACSVRATSLLDGFGGDTVSPYGLAWLSDLARSGRWWSLWRQSRSVAQCMARRTGDVFIREVQNGARSARLLRPARARRWKRRLQESIPIQPALAERVGLFDRIIAQREVLLRADARTQHAAEVTSGVYPFLLEVQDRAAARFGIEVRYPYFDRRLIEFCLALPREQLLRDGWPRAIQRNALNAYLPLDVAKRTTKGNLGPAFARNLATFESDRLHRWVHTDSHLGHYLDRNALGHTLRRFEASRALHDAQVVWAAATIAAWLEQI